MKKITLSGKSRKTIFITLMLVFPLSQFFIFTVYTNFNTILMAFQELDASYNVVWVGLKNFKNFLVDFRMLPIWKSAILNSMGYFPVTVFVSLPLTILVSYFLHNKIWFSGFFKVVFYIPNIVSVVVMALVYKSMFSYNGPIDQFLKLFNVKDIPNWFNEDGITMWILYFYAVWAGIGGNIILVLGAMSRVPQEVREAGALDGVGMWREIVQIYLPIIWPTVSTLIVFGVSTSFAMFIHTIVLCGDGRANSATVASILITEVNKGSQYYASMISIVITAFAIPATQLTKYLVNKIWADVEV